MSASATPLTVPPWPYPRWIAHRGAGKLAPENTLAAFRLGAAHGYRMFECDVKLSADGVPFLLHDATLERTSNGQGLAGNCLWSELCQLDAGSWHSPSFAHVPLPTLAAVAQVCLAEGWMLNIEIKPTPGLEVETGRAVALAAQTLWAHAPVAPLLTSFQPASLLAAKEAAPDLPRGLLLDTCWEGAWDTATSLGCVAMVCNYALWSAETVQQAKNQHMKTLAYTVNDTTTANRLWALGLDGLITDRVHEFNPG